MDLNSTMKTTDQGDICYNLKINTPEWREWLGSGVCIVKFEQISDIVMKFPLLSLKK